MRFLVSFSLLGLLCIVTTPEAYVEEAQGRSRNPYQTRTVPWIAEHYPHPDQDPRTCRTFLNRFCDPDGVLHEQEIRAVENYLQLERSFVPNCTALLALPEVEQRDRPVEIQMGVALVKSMDLSRFRFANDPEMKMAESFARHVHDTWGVGMTTPCGGTGVLLFLSEVDHAVYISRGQALEPYLTKRRINQIIRKMRPFLQEQKYGPAILAGLEDIDRYIQKGPPKDSDGKGEAIAAAVFLGFFGLIIGAAIWGARRDRQNRRQYAAVQDQLSALDEQRAQALQGQYLTRSCPICLESFQSPTSTPQVGSDGLPVKLLRCGHVFDESCWLEWAHSGAGHVDRCPICRENLRSPRSPTLTLEARSDTSRHRLNEMSRMSTSTRLRPRATASTTTRTATMTETLFDDDTASDRNLRTFLQEREYRLHRLSARYPRYVRPKFVQTWTAPGFSAPLSVDPLFRSLDPVVVQQQQRNLTKNGSSKGSGFGGGRSSGGGGGRW